MKRLTIALLLLASVAAFAQDHEDRVIVGIHAKFTPTIRVNNLGNETVWFTVFWYDESIKQHNATICVVRDPKLFKKALRLASVFTKQPFTQIVKVQGRKIKDYYGGWERIVVKRINWLK